MALTFTLRELQATSSGGLAKPEHQTGRAIRDSLLARDVRFYKGLCLMSNLPLPWRLYYNDSQGSLQTSSFCIRTRRTKETNATAAYIHPLCENPQDPVVFDSQCQIGTCIGRSFHRH